MLIQFDIAVLLIIAFSMLFGFLNGFIKTTISFLGYIIAILLAAFLADEFSGLFNSYVDSEASAVMLSAILLFSIFAIILYILNSVLLDILHRYSGGIVDKFFGLSVGLLKGWIILSFATYIAIFIVPQLNVKDRSDVFGDNAKLPNWAQNSETLLMLARSANFVALVLPEDFHNEIKKSIEEANTERGFNFFSNRTDDIRDIHNIFSLLPEGVINEIPQQDLIDLQDQSFSPIAKIDILKKISDLYSDYVNKKVYPNLKEEEKASKRYHEVVTAIEAEIAKYSLEAEDEE